MKVFRYRIKTGESDRLDVDEEMARYIVDLYDTEGAALGYHYSMSYNHMECCYNVTCNRVMANKIIEASNKYRYNGQNVSPFTLDSWTDSFSTKIREASDDLYDKIFGKEEPKMPIKYNYGTRRIPVPVKIINQGPATIVFWDDKTKTIVKCSDNDEFDLDMAITMACLKKMVGDEAYAAAKQMGHKKIIQNMIEWKD